MSRRLIQVGTLVLYASGSDHIKEVDGTPSGGTANGQQRMENGAQRCNGGGGYRKVCCDHASRSRNAVFLCALVVVLIPQWAGPGSTQKSRGEDG